MQLSSDCSKNDCKRFSTGGIKERLFLKMWRFLLQRHNKKQRNIHSSSTTLCLLGKSLTSAGFNIVLRNAILNDNCICFGFFLAMLSNGLHSQLLLGSSSRDRVCVPFKQSSTDTISKNMNYSGEQPPDFYKTADAYKGVAQYLKVISLTANDFKTKVVKNK